jgi:D-alanyl-D-alanine carboxypeptidase
MTVHQLSQGMLIQSANDAAVALDEYVGGTEGLWGDDEQEGKGETGDWWYGDSGFLPYYTYPEVIETTAITKYAFRSGTKLTLTAQLEPDVARTQDGYTYAAICWFNSTARKNGFRLITVVMGWRCPIPRNQKAVWLRLQPLRKN